MDRDEQLRFSAISRNRHAVAGYPLPICRRTVAYRPGQASAALTEHYRRAHPEKLGDDSAK